MRYIDTLNYTEEFEPVHGYKCSDDNHSAFVPADEMFAYNQGELMQIAMPSVSDEDREWLMTGTTPSQWENLFSSNMTKDEAIDLASSAESYNDQSEKEHSSGLEGRWDV